MDNKSTFMLYKDWYSFFESLNMKQRGELITAIFKYQCEEEKTELSGSVGGIFNFMCGTFDVDSKKYTDKCEKRREAGKKGGRPKKETEENDHSENQTKAKKANGFPANQTKAKKAHNHNLNHNLNHNHTLTYSECDNTRDAREEAHSQSGDGLGRFENVILSEAEFEKFMSDHSVIAGDVIEQLSESIATNPEKYTGSHYAWLLKFARNYKPRQDVSTSKYKILE